MGTRLELQEVLENIMSEWVDDPEEHVYFQPPSNIRMKYPCIVYDLEKMDLRHANNGPYNLHNRYSVTVITKDPDSEIPYRVAQLPLISHNRKFENDNLNHNVFQLYF